MSEKNTRYDKTISKLKQNKLLSVLLVFGAVIIAIGSFTDSIDKICKVFKKDTNINAKELNVLYQAISENLELRNQTNSDKDIIAYAEYMNQESKMLVSAWEDVVDALITGAINDDSLLIERLRLKYKDFKEPNAPYFSRLQHFYYLVPIESIKTDSEFVGELSHIIHDIFSFRETSVINLDDLLRGNSTFNFQDKTQADKIDALANSVEELKKVAGRLDALTEALKIQIGQ